MDEDPEESLPYSFTFRDDSYILDGLLPSSMNVTNIMEEEMDGRQYIVMSSVGVQFFVWTSKENVSFTC